MAELNGVAADLDQVQALALTNYGHFTSMRVENQRVRGLSLHLERLMRDCRRLFDADLDADWIRHLIRHALADGSRPVRVRVTVFDPALELGHLGADSQPRILITTRPAAGTPLRALSLQSAIYCRDMPDVKHVGLFGSLQRRRIAQRNRFDDALFVGADATIAEAATSNVGFIDGDRIVWPQANCLPGVTMRLISQARDEDATTVRITLEQLADVDAVFVTNAAVGIRPVSTIDDIHWPDEHLVVGLLRKEYAGLPAELL
ncbi:MAG TPA: aminotransferase class IV family protein [Pseudonocardiaceae bacterium]|nr:aminotransferase class IV family protein [Pseudonocardiaceae bacterium]